MNLDIPTLAFIQCLVFISQVVVLGLQFALDRTSRGLGQWVTGAILMALGVILMPLVSVESLRLLALFSNPIYVMGLFLIYGGVVRFLDGKPNGVLPLALYLAFLLAYLGFLFIDNDLGPRTVVLNAVMAAISAMLSAELLTTKRRDITGSARFVGLVFLLNAGIDVVRGLLALGVPPHGNYQDLGPTLAFAFVYPTVLSTLWTFGFIIMLNQKLNTSVFAEKEKLKRVFDTSPDAAFIARWGDGMVVDINAGFTAMTGYAREEVVGHTNLLVRLWQDPAEHHTFLGDLGLGTSCINRELAFVRQDGSGFTGMISANFIEISGTPHIVGSIHDITERKRSEQKIAELAAQLELERNAALRDSVTDSLTGLPNRRRFDEKLTAEFLRFKRSGVELSLIMLDIDLFKEFSDAFGHQAGDECLKDIGSLFSDLVGRAADMAARYGGEEFAFILPETGSEGARTMAERIRTSVEQLTVRVAASGVLTHVTVSLGVASASTEGLDTPEQLVRLADEALYRAKKAGRNRVEIT